MKNRRRIILGFDPCKVKCNEDANVTVPARKPTAPNPPPNQRKLPKLPKRLPTPPR